MDFNEECDKILIYLKDKTSSLPHETINPGKFEKETKSSVGSSAFRFLEREKKFINLSISAPYSIAIEPAGLVFISETSFVEEQSKKEKLKIYEKEKKDIDLRLGRLSILTQKLTWANIFLTIIFTLVIITIQALNYRREDERLLREHNKEKNDSLLQVKKIYTDSLIDTALRLYLNRSLISPKSK